MRVQYSDNGKHAFFNGEMFTRDDKTGYYLTSNNARMPGRRLNRAVWEYHNGEIPDGYDIHHIDHDKGNNDIENLKCLNRAEHNEIHGVEASEQTKEKRRKHLESIRPLASKWHGSEEGRDWHKEQYQKTKDKLYVRKKYVCQYCGMEYEAVSKPRNRFCSNNCRAAWRRKTGVDDVERICIICGTRFRVNKYQKTATCSPVCACALRRQLMQ